MTLPTVRDAVFATTLLVLSGVVAYDHTAGRRWPAPDATPTGAVDGVALGKAYAPVLADCYGNGWVMAAQVLEAGKPVDDCLKAMQDTFKVSRVRAFEAMIGPKFATVLPEGAEPADAAQRAKAVALWRAFAKGLKGGR